MATFVSNGVFQISSRSLCASVITLKSGGLIQSGLFSSCLVPVLLIPSVVSQNIWFKAIVFGSVFYYYLQRLGFVCLFGFFFLVFVFISAQSSLEVQSCEVLLPSVVLDEMLAPCFA